MKYIFGNINTGFLLLICFIFVSCQELITPDNLDDDEKIPVIQGMVTNNPGPYLIYLSWASPFTGDANEPIIGAVVTITDDKGALEQLEETAYGIYKTKNGGIRGTIGNSYKLRIELLPDHTVYESSSVLMKDIPVVDNFYAEEGKNEIININYYGDVIVTEQKGLHVYFDINTHSEIACYYRIDALYYAQYVYYIIPEEEPMPIPVFCIYDKVFGEMPNIKSTLFNGSEHVVRKHSIGFLPWIYDPFNTTDTTTAPMPHGWITSIRIYSIDEDAYNHYQAIIDQLEARERIFDPIATQVRGNIKCISDNNKIALGLFEVASFNNYFVAFYWGGSTEYNKLLLSDYSWPGHDSCSVDTMPDYWIW